MSEMHHHFIPASPTAQYLRLKPDMKTAIVIGATGLVGGQLVQQLLEDPEFSRVLSFGRRSIGIRDARLTEHIIDFEHAETWEPLVRGDVLFSTLGTTLAQAGSKAAQYRVDHSYQLRFAEAAAAGGVPVYVLISAAGADPRSLVFYSRMKGELDLKVSQLSFSSVNILRPGLLAGERAQSRPGERIAYMVLRAINKIGLAKKYRPVEARIVARAMIRAAIQGRPGVHIHTLDEVFRLAGEPQQD